MRKRIERRTTDRISGPSGRLRIDRHEEREGKSGASDPVAVEPARRVRRDPRTERRGTRAAGAGSESQISPMAVRQIADPACLILAVPDVAGNRLSVADRELLGAGRRLADSTGGALVALICAAGIPGALDQAGVDRVLPAPDARFDGYAPELRCAAVVAAAGLLNPRHIIFPDTPTNGGDVGRRVAAEMNERPACAVQSISAASIVSRGQGGANDIVRPLSRLLVLAPGAFAPHVGAPHEARSLTFAAVAADVRLVDCGQVDIDANALPLAEADFIVSAGNGVTDWAAFHDVVAALRATEGGSRVVVDAGFLPRERQVGASGTLVEPRCYLAFGIAGAPQHLQGIARCERVVAVNTDLHAEMVKRADVAIIADAQAVMPALARLAIAERSRA